MVHTYNNGKERLPPKKDLKHVKAETLIGILFHLAKNAERDETKLSCVRLLLKLKEEGIHEVKATGPYKLEDHLKHMIKKGRTAG